MYTPRATFSHWYLYCFLPQWGRCLSYDVICKGSVYLLRVTPPESWLWMWLRLSLKDLVKLQTDFLKRCLETATKSFSLSRQIILYTSSKLTNHLTARVVCGGKTVHMFCQLGKSRSSFCSPFFRSPCFLFCTWKWREDNLTLSKPPDPFCSISSVENGHRTVYMTTVTTWWLIAGWHCQSIIKNTN